MAKDSDVYIREQELGERKWLRCGGHAEAGNSQQEQGQQRQREQSTQLPQSAYFKELEGGVRLPQGGKSRR